MQGLEWTQYMWGGPELVRNPIEKWIYDFADSHKEAFVKLWHYDVEKIISSAKKDNIPVVLMTYHLQPLDLPPEEFVSMAQKFKIPLVRNDIVFSEFIKNGTIRKYLLENKDNWHPNKKGYGIIAQDVFKVIVENHLLE